MKTIDNFLKRVSLISVILLISLILVSCTSPKEVGVVNEQIISTPDTIEEQQIVQEEENGLAPKVYSAEVQALLNKRINSNNYQYTYSASKLNKYNYYESSEIYTLSIKGDQMKKVYLSPIELKNDIFYNTVYFDNTAKSASVICLDGGVLCNDFLKKVYVIDYTQEMVTDTPVKILQDLPSETVIAGKEMVDSRSATILQYQEGENTVKVSVDSYYILPIKKVVQRKEAGGEITLLSTENFKIVNVNSLTDADFKIPAEYELVK